MGMMLHRTLNELEQLERGTEPEKVKEDPAPADQPEEPVTKPQKRTPGRKRTAK